MTTIAHDRKVLATPAIPEPPLGALVHIPGTDGWPLFRQHPQIAR